MSVAIRVSPDTRAKLKTIGQKGETYDRVINLLLTVYAQAGKEHGAWLDDVEELWRCYEA